MYNASSRKIYSKSIFEKCFTNIFKKIDQAFGQREIQLEDKKQENGPISMSHTKCVLCPSVAKKKLLYPIICEHTSLTSLLYFQMILSQSVSSWL